MIKIAIANNKGGVGKTPVTQLLGTALSSRGYQVALMDLDGQANLTDALVGSARGRRPQPNIGHVLDQTHTLLDVPRVAITPGGAIWLFTSDENLDDVADDLVTKPLGVLRLRSALEQDDLAQLNQTSGMDFLLIDCPPNLSALTYSALIAADYVLIPTKPEEWAIKGVDRVLDKLQEIQAQLGRSPVCLGVVATMVQERIEHQKNLTALGHMGHRVKLLGQTPLRNGQDASEKLFTAYNEIAGALLGQLGMRAER